MTGKRRSLSQTIIFVVLVGLLSSSFVSAQSTETHAETRQLLAKMGGNRRGTAQLTTLFRVGDERIDDLIKALDDSDENVRLNAQVIIRYLGNERGMSTLLDRYEKTDPRSYIVAERHDPGLEAELLI